jgi:hypothetical protein
VTNLRLSEQGLSELAALGRELKATGDKRLWKEAQSRLSHATDPLKAEVPQSARRKLPHSGGLGEYVAQLKIATKVQLSGRDITVRIRSTRAKGAHMAHRTRMAKRRLKNAGRKQTITSTAFGAGLIDLDALDRGRAKHPTYGHRPWVVQEVEPGFWTEVMRGPMSVRARRAILAAIDEIRKELASGRRAA